jgi:hypothetical protein
VLTQQLMPLTLRGLMDPHVWLAFMRLSWIFRKICVKVWDLIKLPMLQEDVATTLNLLEWELPEALCDDTFMLICGWRVGHMWPSAC